MNIFRFYSATFEPRLAMRERRKLRRDFSGSPAAIVSDDSGLGTDIHPPAFTAYGDPGPSKLAKEINRPPFVEIQQVRHNRVFQKNSA